MSVSPLHRSDGPQVANTCPVSSFQYDSSRVEDEESFLLNYFIIWSRLVLVGIHTAWYGREWSIEIITVER